MIAMLKLRQYFKVCGYTFQGSYSAMYIFTALLHCSFSLLFFLKKKKRIVLENRFLKGFHCPAKHRESHKSCSLC